VEVLVAVGEQVALDQVVARLVAVETDAPEDATAPEGASAPEDATEKEPS
jgi:pyruvate/2-oxoglutarate dehydrogenase complex dihydrolipoamide acyltransferase (E2) component